MLGRCRESLKGDRRHLFDSYRFVEMARKVVGVGSVGTRAWDPGPHARSGDRVAIGAYLGKGESFDNAIADFSQRYADQNELDYGALADAAKSGRVKVETDLD